MQQIGEQPLILVSMGTMYNDEPRFYRACFEAFGGSAHTVALAVGRRVDCAALGEPPANFIVRPYLPQFALLQRAALFITHGGINSAHEAMLHGVPMVVLPQSADHHIVARQVERAGAGVVFDRSQVDAAHLLRLANQVLPNPEYKRNSGCMGETLRRAGGPARAAQAILAFKKKAEIG
jgi:MGT family glycosyltransferase